MDSLELWADGSGTTADGPACIGVVAAIDGERIAELSAYVGDGSNIFAELNAIWYALQLLDALAWQRGRFIPKLYTDSLWSIKALACEYRTHHHVELIRMIACEVHLLGVELVHVKGHQDNVGNVIADWLAGEARRREMSRPDSPHFTSRDIRNHGRPDGFGKWGGGLKPKRRKVDFP